jgi:membrane-associated phospholipid phosphatase
LFRLNAGTKWIVTVLNTLSVWTRPHRYEGPLVVSGAIAAVYFTAYLKQIINQGRPEGAPFTDPGMPSSHSLTCFFIASAWSSLLLLAPAASMLLPTVVVQSLFWMGAMGVAWLRVVCGYHSPAQVVVGASLGSILGWLWVLLGQASYGAYPKTTLFSLWALYLSGAVLFISKYMRNWITHEKHL